MKNEISPSIFQRICTSSNEKFFQIGPFWSNLIIQIKQQIVFFFDHSQLKYPGNK